MRAVLLAAALMGVTAAHAGTPNVYERSASGLPDYSRPLGELTATPNFAAANDYAAACLGDACQFFASGPILVTAALAAQFTVAYSPLSAELSNLSFAVYGTSSHADAIPMVSGTLTATDTLTGAVLLTRSVDHAFVNSLVLAGIQSQGVTITGSFTLHPGQYYSNGELVAAPSELTARMTFEQINPVPEAAGWALWTFGLTVLGWAHCTNRYRSSRSSVPV